MANVWEDNPAINNFRDYLRIRSVQPNINYDECINYLKGQAKGLGLPVQVYEVVPTKPVLVMSWEGTEPSLTSIMLNSHMDVVPVFEKSWVHPPFAGHMDKDGKIYGRGAQDMKSVAIQYIESVRKLKESGVRLKRTLHLSFVPDEEIGGIGMSTFVKTEHYKQLNVGFSLDEGIASPNEDYLVFYGERSVWHVHFHCSGKSGHGSLLFPNTAGEKIHYIINKLMELRAVEKKKLDDDPELTVGDVTTVNMTKLYGGVQSNVIPEKLSVTFDIRLALSVNHQDFGNMLEKWALEAGDGVTVEYEQKDIHVDPTPIDDSNAYWVAFRAEAERLGMKIKTRVFPGGTDSRFVRGLGVPALGFSPITNTQVQLHEHNESLSAATFLDGIDTYVNLITAIANVPVSKQK